MSIIITITIHFWCVAVGFICMERWSSTAHASPGVHHGNHVKHKQNYTCREERVCVLSNACSGDCSKPASPVLPIFVISSNLTTHKPLTGKAKNMGLYPPDLNDKLGKDVYLGRSQSDLNPSCPTSVVVDYAPIETRCASICLQFS